MQCKTFRSNNRFSFSKLDTLLAWLAIFLWETQWTQQNFGVDGFMGSVSSRVLKKSLKVADLACRLW
jgi:hypothetical protein